MKWFPLKKSSYKKRADGKTWTKNQLLKKVVEELTPVQASLVGNTIVFARFPLLSLEMITSNYAQAGELELNGSLFFQVGEESILWDDLFSYAKCCRGSKYRAMRLYKDESWEGSTMQTECQELFLPMLALLVDPKTRLRFMGREPLTYCGKTVPPPCSAVSVTPELSQALSSPVK